jgi:hypothetical protein
MGLKIKSGHSSLLVKANGKLMDECCCTGAPASIQLSADCSYGPTCIIQPWDNQASWPSAHSIQIGAWDALGGLGNHYIRYRPKIPVSYLIDPALGMSINVNLVGGICHSHYFTSDWYGTDELPYYYYVDVAGLSTTWLVWWGYNQGYPYETEWCEVRYDCCGGGPWHKIWGHTAPNERFVRAASNPAEPWERNLWEMPGGIKSDKGNVGMNIAGGSYTLTHNHYPSSDPYKFQVRYTSYLGYMRSWHDGTFGPARRMPGPLDMYANLTLNYFDNIKVAQQCTIGGGGPVPY